MSGGHVLSAESYSNILPSFSFIALSVCATAILEYLDISLDLNFSEIGEGGKVKIIVHFIVMIIMMIIYFVVFVNNIKKVSGSSFYLSFFELLLNILMIVVVSYIHLKTKRLLELCK